MTSATAFFAFGSLHACQLVQEFNAPSPVCSPDYEIVGAIAFYSLAAANVLGLGLAIVALSKRRRPSRLRDRQTPTE